MTSPLSVEGNVRFVQFPHPGPEHAMSSTGKRPWKLGNERHARTFLQSPGRYRLDAGGRDHSGEVCFWGEWEGAVDLVTELDPVPGGPRFLCRPDPAVAPPVASDGTPPQNTDPFVWGDAIRYTFCRQPGNRKLRHLGRGSLILFGSSVRHRFVLDTALVVAGWIEHRRASDLSGIDDAYRKATVGPMYGWGDDGHTYRMYVGATPADPVDGMFSFVPCLPASGAESGFARPAIEFDESLDPRGELINPNARMQARVIDVPSRELAELWRSVLDQVLRAELCIATRLDL